ncbi:MAG: IS66 family insertion sequence element accessory protein TnpA [Dolichospermum sp.]
MFAEVELWHESGFSKTQFLSQKDYSEAKFNYWLAKWKACQQHENVQSGFEELNWKTLHTESYRMGKVLEIEAPSGVRITVFA